ncbi:MAG TPA: GntR family transcriptional regulator [Phycisphaerae bacterium]|nr:GntR family transcriptional regulator [Phycisphaerae bacterium]HOJ75016.1 GntR family transcriptional regulator [Phycisphaerae bacterium]HOM51887.1 GntR family transcriptional regulator [Phycisphaerae bacterium]HON68198.1 GntR family transcriptional regulator [Phycisphaerae bacterium]HOQ84931.1 GntR family transcriptional regulator [Phycisphaerae bacterium]
MAKASRTASLRDHLLQAMAEQRIPLGSRLPSETELMQKFSLSRSSVRQVLAELSVSGWVERRQGLGTFHVAGNRREPAKSQRTMLVGVWFNWPSGPLFSPMVDGIREELAEWRYHAVFEDGGFDVGAEAKGVEALVQKTLDGFIVAPSSNPADDHRPLEQLIARKVPLVLVDRPLPGHPADVVMTANELGAEEVVQYLIELGHRRIAFIGSGGLASVDDRLRGYRLAMRRAGLTIDEAWLQADQMAGEDSGRRAANLLLDLPADRCPTAIFCANDIIGMTVGMVARSRHIRVPDQLSIAGFDDIVPTAEHEPWLTTYAQPKRRIGQQAARLLLQRISSPGANPVTLLLQGSLVKRGSTAPPAA